MSVKGMSDCDRGDDARDATARRVGSRYACISKDRLFYQRSRGKSLTFDLNA